MPTENNKAKRGFFPRGEARVEARDITRPPADRMLRPDRRFTKARFREVASSSPAEALDHLED